MNADGNLADWLVGLLIDWPSMVCGTGRMYYRMGEGEIPVSQSWTRLDWRSWKKKFYFFTLLKELDFGLIQQGVAN